MKKFNFNINQINKRVLKIISLAAMIILIMSNVTTLAAHSDGAVIRKYTDTNLQTRKTTVSTATPKTEGTKTTGATEKVKTEKAETPQVKTEITDETVPIVSAATTITGETNPEEQTVDISTVNKTLTTEIQNRNIDPTKPMIALTYDDGPSHKVTNKILDILEKYNIKATFFVVGDRVNNSQANKDALERADDMGCEIGNHTYNHKNISKIKEAEVVSEIDKTKEAVFKVIGKEPKLLRPPYGAYSKKSEGTMVYPLILWSVDTEDWKSRNAETVTGRVIGKIKDGDIILMHDLYNSTVEASEIIIPQLIEEGYQFVTVSELAYYKNVELSSGTQYRYIR